MSDVDRLKRELAARAIRTMGPRSPFWNCTICGAAHLTPADFKHKPECMLADEPLPAALWPEGTQEREALRVTAPELLALLRELVDIEGPQPGHSAWAQKVDAAIAKATGAAS